jgi:hypothetical protein
MMVSSKRGNNGGEPHKNDERDDQAHPTSDFCLSVIPQSTRLREAAPSSIHNHNRIFMRLRPAETLTLHR